MGQIRCGHIIFFFLCIEISFALYTPRLAHRKKVVAEKQVSVLVGTCSKTLA